MLTIYETAQQFKQRLVSRERAASAELLRSYGRAHARLADRVAVLTGEIESRRAAGETISSGFLYERDRLANIKRDLARELGRFSRIASTSATLSQRDAAHSAAIEARALISISSGVPVAGADLAAAESLAGFASNGSPLSRLFDELGRETSERMTAELVSGVAEGAPARVIAARMRSASALGLSRSLTIARTETLRAYRETTGEVYEQHAALLRGWVWLSSLSGATCALCVAMHGRVFPVARRLVSHPNCSCVPAPLTHDADAPETGEAWLDRQEDGLQKSVLGAAKFEAYKDGKLKVADLVGVKRSAKWGDVPYIKSLDASRRA